MQLPRWGSNFMDDKKILDKKLCNNSTHTRKPRSEERRVGKECRL